MARREKTFSVNEEKKIITIWTNLEENAEDEKSINWYVRHGYTPKLAQKKPSVKVAEIREELKNAPDTLNEFNAKYKEKGGFHNAMKFYNDWKKAQKAEAEAK